VKDQQKEDLSATFEKRQGDNRIELFYK
jgi:hypothetical protein